MTRTEETSFWTSLRGNVFLVLDLRRGKFFTRDDEDGRRIYIKFVLLKKGSSDDCRIKSDGGDNEPSSVLFGGTRKR